MATARDLKLCAEVLCGLSALDKKKEREAVEAVPVGERVALKIGHLSSGPIALMLAGLALERLTKAVLTKNNPEAFTGDKFPGWFTAGHNIGKLVTRAGIQVSDDSG